LLEYAREVRKPVSLQPGLNERLIGGILLHIRRDASVCRLIAAEGYDGDLGIRSLINAVRDTVELSLFDSYLKVEKVIEEGQQMADYVVDVRNDEVAISIVSPKDEEEM
jgi:ATP-dependent Clp protease ATP-binding subunit ClpA